MSVLLRIVLSFMVQKNKIFFEVFFFFSQQLAYY